MHFCEALHGAVHEYYRADTSVAFLKVKLILFLDVLIL